MFGDDDEELDEAQESEVDLEDDESFDDDDEETEEVDQDSDEAEAAGFDRPRRRIDPDESDFTHAVDCSLDENCTCDAD